VDFLEVDNLVVFYYLSASEIWPDKSRWPLVGVAVLEGDYCERGLIRVALLEGDYCERGLIRVALLEGDYCERGLIRVGGLWWEWPLIGVAFGGTLGVALLVGEYCNSITNRKLWHLVKSDVTGYILTRG
jgi:hypothetical protein